MVGSKEVTSKIIESGADGAGIVSLSSLPEEHRKDAERLFPKTKSAISYIVALHIPAMQTMNLPLISYEIHRAEDRLREVGFKAARWLAGRGIEAVMTIPGFPMSMDRWGGKVWDISHKPIAIAAGLGTMGINRDVLHPGYGAQILLSTLLVDAEFDSYDRPLEHDVCLKCNLCVKICPVGALSPKGLDFMRCFTNVYRHSLSGFLDFIGTLVESRDSKELKRVWGDPEIMKVWQSLTTGGVYSCGFCQAACPAHRGDDYRSIKAQYDSEMLRRRDEWLSVSYLQRYPGGERKAAAVSHVGKRKVVSVRSRFRTMTGRQAVEGLPHLFRPAAAKDLNAVIQIKLSGDGGGTWCLTIRDQRCEVLESECPNPALVINTAAETWAKIATKELNPVHAMLTRKLRVKGDLSLLRKFDKLFPLPL